jgi:hypothetical protein
MRYVSSFAVGMLIMWVFCVASTFKNTRMTTHALVSCINDRQYEMWKVTKDLHEIATLLPKPIDLKYKPGQEGK